MTLETLQKSNLMSWRKCKMFTLSLPNCSVSTSYLLSDRHKEIRQTVVEALMWSQRQQQWRRKNERENHLMNNLWNFQTQKSVRVPSREWIYLHSLSLSLWCQCSDAHKHSMRNVMQHINDLSSSHCHDGWAASRSTEGKKFPTFPLAESPQLIRCRMGKC